MDVLLGDLVESIVDQILGALDVSLGIVGDGKVFLGEDVETLTGISVFPVGGGDSPHVFGSSLVTEAIVPLFVK